MSIQLELPFPPEEIWKDIPGWEGYYQVSNAGLVRRIGSGKGVVSGRILSLHCDGSGYPMVDLYVHPNEKTIRIHRLVMLAFVGECPEGMQVNHINGVKGDNRLENLEYVTHRRNAQHAWEIGLHIPQRGEDTHNAKLTNVDVLKIISLLKKKEETIASIAKRYNVRYQTIQCIKSGKSWRHLQR